MPTSIVGKLKLLKKKRTLNRSQRDRTLQPPQRHPCRSSRNASVSIGPNGTVLATRIEDLGATEYTQSQSVPTGPYFATIILFSGGDTTLEVSIGPNGTALCNTERATADGSQRLGLNRSQRDRTLQRRVTNDNPSS